MERPGRIFRNPIIPGFHPDPSVCRVGPDFYLVNSSFVCFPGLPIFRSRDLVHWRQIGNVLDRPSQLDLDGSGHSRGLFAPTLRYSAGRFYLVCTNVDKGGNFVVTASDPAGPWSDPVWLPDAPGIDPSLFFDDDGRCWYSGTRPVPEGERYPGNWEVWVQEFDARDLSLAGEPTGIWRGALRDCVWPEGPHLYRVGPWYYLLAAEGGTERRHAVSVARSADIRGPWEGNPANPILTHRHLGSGQPIVNVGHGDLADDGAGGWWMVLLGSRPQGGEFCNLGRETFLVPVAWEDGWPIASPGTGRVMESYPVPDLSPDGQAAPEDADYREDFDAPGLPPRWVTLRTPRSDFYSLCERPGFLRLRLLPSTLRQNAHASFLGIRQLHHDYRLSACVEFVPGSPGEAVGLALVQSADFQYRLELGSAPGGDRSEVRLIAAEGAEDRVLVRHPVSGGRFVLSAEVQGQLLRFSWGQVSMAPPPPTEGQVSGPLEVLAAGIDGRALSTERAGGFVGTLLGLFATSGGERTGAVDRFADFDWFEYGPADPA